MNILNKSLFFSSFSSLFSTPGTSAVAIDNKIEQAMVSANENIYKFIHKIANRISFNYKFEK